jgi:peptidoglycan/xylan/chitin deacetylase (PgdA/CDA1 family)
VAYARAETFASPLSGPTPVVHEPSPPLDPAPPPEPSLGGGLVVTGATTRPMLLFTFDDGPDPDVTPAILDELDRHEVRAVFFVVPQRLAGHGPHAEEEAALLREIARRGHVVGSHSMRHRHLHLLSEAEMQTEVLDGEAAIAAVLGERPLLFRPPGGARSEASDAFLRERGYTQFLWNVITADFTTDDADVVVRTFARSLRGRIAHGSPGGVVLLHDTHRWTAEALPRILALVDAENCARLARGEELIDPSPDPSWFVVAADGDPSTSAPAATPPEDAFAAHQAELIASARERCPR